MKIVKNCALALGLTVRYAPWSALLYILVCLIPGFFGGLRVVLVQKLVDGGVRFGATGQGAEELIATGSALVAMLFIWFVLERLQGYEDKALEIRLIRNMGPDIMEKLDGLEYAAFESPQVQGILQRIGGEPWENVKSCFGGSVRTVQTLLSIFIMLGVYATVSPWIGAGIFLLAVPMLALNFAATRRLHALIRDTTMEERRLEDLKRLMQNPDAMYEMKVFGSQELMAEKWHRFAGRVEEETGRAGGRVLALEGGSRFLNITYFIFIIITLSYLFLQGRVTVGQFAAVTGSLHSITGQMLNAAWTVSDTFRSALDVAYYSEFLKLPQRRDRRQAYSGAQNLPLECFSSAPPDSRAESIADMRQSPSPVRIDGLAHGDIAFENVSFTYPDTDRQVLKNVTFRIKAGERVAFVGENGAGKSTLVKLLCGLYEPDAGRVLMGGVDVRSLSEPLRRKCLSVVFQDFQEYELTLRENVALGDISALSEDRRIEEALEQAGGAQLIREGNGLEQSLGHLEAEGRGLSRGQWQRVAIARAFLADAAFCVLDEPTAALDPIAESRMYASFLRAFRKNGTIIISHRLASARLADRILVLDGGRIVQDGSHGQLMGMEGLYRTMYLAQSSWYAESPGDRWPGESEEARKQPDGEEPGKGQGRRWPGGSEGKTCPGEAEEARRQSGFGENWGDWEQPCPENTTGKRKVPGESPASGEAGEGPGPERAGGSL